MGLGKAGARLVGCGSSAFVDLSVAMDLRPSRFEALVSSFSMFLLELALQGVVRA